MEVLAWLLVGLAGYLPGSVPAGLIAGRMKGIDLRKVGSGNIGATNALRNLGTGIGIAVLIFDALKGLLPCLFFPGLLIGLFPEGSAPVPETLGLVVGAAAILGHNFPCWLRLKGGKGIATTAGVVGGLAPIPFAVCLCSWILFLAVTRYVSLASIAAAVALPIAAAAWPSDTEDRFGPLFWICLFLGVMAVWKHRSNLQRLRQGIEPKAWSKKRDHD
ncbi:MAG: glycerol-3-phosphate 1-O-acyltransferase PlsY [Limisphaerales bacterium]